MSHLREKLQRFMIGRYGSDQFSRFLVWAVLFLILINILAKSRILWFLELVLIVYSYYRMFSRDFGRRQKENQLYQGLEFAVKEKIGKFRFYADQSKEFHIYKCPKCHQKIRIPRGRGRVSIHCPKCGTDFIKKS